MNAYVYAAALVCEGCGDKIRARLTSEGLRPAAGMAESDTWPCGASNDPDGAPFPDGGGESDSPEHCDVCGGYLDNPLTREGVAFVCETLREYLRTHGDHGAPDTLATWAESLAWYGEPAHRIARRFLARYERYAQVIELRRRFHYAGGGYGFRWSSPLERPGGGPPSSRSSDPDAEICGECGEVISPLATDETRSNGGTEWVHERDGAGHEAYPWDPADAWEIVIAPEGAYRPVRREVIDGSPCVVFEHEGTGETYAVTEVSARIPANDARAS